MNISFGKKALFVLYITVFILIPVRCTFAAGGEVKNGVCGESQSWQFDPSKGELHISGSSNMYSYPSEVHGDAPWKEFKDDIIKLKVDNGIKTIGSGAFSACSKLESIDLPESLNEIGMNAFYDCTSIKKIIIPDSVEVIGSGAFSLCESLKEVGLPLKLKKVSDLTFYYCSDIESIVIPESVDEIGEDAFTGCVSLKSIDVKPNNSEYASKDGVLFNKSITELIFYPSGNTQDFYTVPGSVKIILTNAFSNSKFLSKVILPSSLSEIGEGAFSECLNLEEISIPDGMTELGESAFSKCVKLKTINIPKSVSTINKGVFEYCESLKTVALPDGMKTIPSRMFLNCVNMSSIKIPDSVQSIDSYAFYGCSSLKTLRTNASISLMAFAKTGVEKAVLLDGAEKIDNLAFYGCSSLSEIILPQSITSVNLAAFANDNNLKKIDYYGTKAAWDKIKFKNTSSWENNEKYLSSETKISYSPTLEDLAVEYIHPSDIVLEENDASIKISWNAVSDANSYEIYRKSGNGKWGLLKKTKKLKYTDTDIKKGKVYYYKVRVKVDGILTGFSESEKTILLSTPKLSSVTNTENGLSIKWKKTAGAKGYYLYRRAGSGKWNKIKQLKGIDTVTYIDDGAKKQGQKYSYKVKAYYGSCTSNASSEIKIYRLITPEIKSVDNSKPKKLKVSWKKTKKVTGYEVKYTGGTTKTIAVKGADKVSKTISSLKKGKTYKVYVRSYKTDSGKKYYSAWSPVSKKKVK